MANTKISWSRLKKLPTERPLVKGQNYFVENADNSLSLFSVTSDGEPKFIRGIDDSEKAKMIRLTDDKLTKLETLDTQPQLDEKLMNATKGDIPVIGTTLPQTTNTPNLPNTGKAVLLGASLGDKIYTQIGGSSITVSAGNLRFAYYNKTTDLWVQGEESPLPSIPINNTFGTSTTEAISQAKTTEVNTKVDSVTKTSFIPTQQVIPSALMARSYSATGQHGVNQNWISTDIMDIPAGFNKIKIEGYGQNSTAKTNRLFYYNNDTFLEMHGSGTFDPFTDDVPVGANKFAVQLDGGTGVASDLPNSPYQQTFKAYAISEAVAAVVIDTEKIIDRIESDQIIHIESVISEIDNGNKYYDGIGYPPSDLGNDTDKYLDTDSKRLYIKSNGDWGSGIYMGEEFEFDFPADFTYRPFDIRVQSNGFAIPQIKSVFDEFIKDDYERLTKYYVDPIAGNDGSDGLTPQTAYKNLNTAIVTKGARNIELLPCNGFYPRAANLNVVLDIATSEPLIIRAPQKVYMAASDKGNTFTWTNVGDNTFSTSRSNVWVVIDTNLRDSRGDYTTYKKAATLAECKAMAGSWYLDGSTLNVHTLNNLQPSTNIEVGLSTFNRYTPTANVPYIYFENIDFYNNNNSEALGIRNNASTQFDTKVYFKNVGGIKNAFGNGLAVDNIKETYFEGCRGWGNLRDGLNYHTSLLTSGYTPMKIVEMNCTAGDSGLGQTAETSSNASTTHEGQTIIRLNNKFDNTHGSTIADVNAGAMSLNINVQSNNCILDNDACFRINGAGSKMWLYYCSGKSSNITVKTIQADTGSKAFKDANTKTPNGTSGDVTDI